MNQLEPLVLGLVQGSAWAAMRTRAIVSHFVLAVLNLHGGVMQTAKGWEAEELGARAPRAGRCCPRAALG